MAKILDKIKGVADKAQGVGTGMDIQSILNRPSVGIPALYFGGKFVGEEVLGPLTKAAMDFFSGGPQKRMRAQYEFERKGLLEGMRAQLEQDQKRRSIAINATRLMETDPHLAQEVMLGRKLPRGATVLGYRPRVDLLEQLAGAMGQGEFTSSRDALEAYMAASGASKSQYTAKMGPKGYESSLTLKGDEDLLGEL